MSTNSFNHLSCRDALLPGLPVDRILACFANAPGNEIDSGKFLSPVSSSALAANTFGFFLERAADLPPLPGCENLVWAAEKVNLEAIVRFPWSGGRHPCLDALIETSTALIGIESKRYEPFGPKKKVDLSGAYWRDVWGKKMDGFKAVRDALVSNSMAFAHLDAVQLVKHAFGLRTAAHRDKRLRGRQPVLFYLYAEPRSWPDGRAISTQQLRSHRAEVALFARAIQGDEVAFVSASYGDLLSGWCSSQHESVRAHGLAVTSRFFI